MNTLDKNGFIIHLGDVVSCDLGRGVVNRVGSVEVGFIDETTGEQLVTRPRFAVVDLEASPEHRDRRERVRSCLL